MADQHHHHHHYHSDHSRYSREAGNYGSGSPNPHRLYRSRQKIIAGVCGGIANYFGWERSTVRLVVLVLGIFGLAGPLIMLYIVAWLFMEKEPLVKPFMSQEDERFWRSVATKPRVTFATLKHKFRALDSRLESMERTVISNEFELERQFADLEKNGR
ncbi:MAG TPA: envelope stress response membrane protein PspC [Oceanospirillales bacterium]|nr:envelope stress response membrane protein PspC [Oceanospirillales bacterium]|tara:strand:+ start:2427 stop:2900 length:474 start_codon:yes stop_codon:yes gene_type:complete